MVYKDKKKKEYNPFLSISQNFRRDLQGIKLDVRNQSAKKVKTEFELKQKLVVYVDENKRFYINRSTAYALGFNDVRAIMLEGSDNLVEITKLQLASIETRDNIEVVIEKFDSQKVLPNRPKIKVYRDNLDLFIDMAAAYSLGLITVENFNAMSNEMYRVSENILVFLENKYDVEYIEKEESFGSR